MAILPSWNANAALRVNQKAPRELAGQLSTTTRGQYKRPLKGLNSFNRLFGRYRESRDNVLEARLVWLNGGSKGEAL